MESSSHALDFPRVDLSSVIRDGKLPERQSVAAADTTQPRPRLCYTVCTRLESDAGQPLLYDVVSMGDDVVIVTDCLNNKIKAFCPQTGACLSVLGLEDSPLGIAEIELGTVAVTVHQRCHLLIIRVAPELLVVDQIVTTKAYRGVAVLPLAAAKKAAIFPEVDQAGLDSTPVTADHQGVLCVTAPGCIDLLDLRGKMLKTFPFNSPPLALRSPVGLAVRPPSPGDQTKLPRLLVTDVEARSVFEILLTGDGRVLSQSPEDSPFDWPLGVGCDEAGTVYVTDLGNHSLLCLKPESHCPQTLLSRQDGLCFPRGLFVSKGGFLWITQDQWLQVFQQV